MDLCEPMYVYTYDSEIPKLLSIICHLPIIPILCWICLQCCKINNTNDTMFNVYNNPKQHTNAIHNNTSQNQRVFIILVQIFSQILFMIGHVLINPGGYMIPELSSLVMMYWMYLYINALTSKEHQLCIRHLVVVFIEFSVVNILLGMHMAIFINSALLIYYVNRFTLLDLVNSTKRHRLLNLFVLTKLILICEIILCQLCMSAAAWFQLHLVFDVLCWQLLINLALYYLIH